MKVICKYCGKDIKEVEGCNERIYVSKDSREKKAMINQNDEPCSSCKAKPGKYHHVGCAQEMCPQCNDFLADCQHYKG